MAPKPEPSRRIVADNRAARYHYTIEDTLEAGIALTGTEVKSLRGGKAQIKDGYAALNNGELWLYNVHIPPYANAYRDNHEPERPRKLLLHKSELQRLEGRVKEKGLTLVPTRVYFKGPWAKIEIALGRGKTGVDRRRDIKEREQKREIDQMRRWRKRWYGGKPSPAKPSDGGGHMSGEH